jgi:hypothetical protein
MAVYCQAVPWCPTGARCKSSPSAPAHRGATLGCTTGSGGRVGSGGAARPATSPRRFAAVLSPWRHEIVQMPPGLTRAGWSPRVRASESLGRCRYSAMGQRQPSDVRPGTYTNGQQEIAGKRRRPMHAGGCPRHRIFIRSLISGLSAVCACHRGLAFLGRRWGERRPRAPHFVPSPHLRVWSPLLEQRPS